MQATLMMELDRSSEIISAYQGFKIQKDLLTGSLCSQTVISRLTCMKSTDIVIYTLTTVEA